MFNRIHLLLLVLVAIQAVSCKKKEEVPPAHTLESSEIATTVAEEKEDLSPVRPFPEKFPRKSTMPSLRESQASGAISNSQFSAGRDLVYIEDSRVWFESDHDGESDDECDHSMNKSMVLPFKRLVEMCAASNAVLRVQEAYRSEGVHSGRSLHKEGRALDLTCPGLDPDNPNKERPSPKSLEILAKLTWAAGFDWVYYECPKKSGPHIHASVKSQRE